MQPVSRFKSAFAVTAVAAMLSLLTDPAHAVGTPTGTVINSQATMTYKDANLNSYSASSNTVSATVTSVFSVSLTCAGDQSTNSSTTAYYACTVTNTGNASNTFTLSASSPPLWSTVLYRDDGAGAGGVADDGIHTAGEVTVTGSTGEIAADASYRFFVAATVPAGTPNATTALTTLTVTGTGDATGADDSSDTMTTTALAPALTVVKNLRNLTTAGAFGESASAKPLQTLEYRLEVTNGGTVQATEVVLQETLNANLEYVAGTMRYGATATYSEGVALTDASSGDALCAAPECGTGNYSTGVLTFRLGSGATEAAGGALATTKTVYVFFHAKVK